MIIPSYSLTSTERILPRLALDWTTGLAQPGVDVVRAGTATFVDSDGYIKAASADTQRIDYSTGVAGLLIEESRTNYCLRSREFGAWLAGNTSVSADTIVSPSNITDADTITESNSIGPYSIQTPGVNFDGTYVFFVYAKAGTATWIQLLQNSIPFPDNTFANFDLVNGVVGNVGEGATSASIYDAGNGWYRCSIVATTDGSGFYRSAVYLIDNTDVTTPAPVYSGTGKYVYLWGAQVEQGTFPTSYIATGGSAVTRNADVATMTGTNFSDWFNATEGTLKASLSTFETRSVETAFVSANSGNNLNQIALFKFATSAGLSVRDGTTQAERYTAGAISDNTVFTLCGSYKENLFRAAKNGGSPTSPDTSGTLPTPTQLQIGRAGSSNVFNGIVRSIYYWPQSVTPAELSSFSKQ